MRWFSIPFRFATSGGQYVVRHFVGTTPGEAHTAAKRWAAQHEGLQLVGPQGADQDQRRKQ